MSKKTTIRRAAALALAAGLALQPLAYATAAYAEEAVAASEESSATEASSAYVTAKGSYASGVRSARRFYNPWSGEHIYTYSDREAASLSSAGWKAEGAAWSSPDSTNGNGTVYRLYNRWSGDHHYTKSYAEYKECVAQGWNGEGAVFSSNDSNRSVPVYRLYNPYVTVGTHHYTTSKEEYDSLPKYGWRQEGVAFYACKYVQDKAAYDAVEWVETKAAWDEPVYETTSYCVCSKCHERCYAEGTAESGFEWDSGVTWDRHCRAVHSQEGYWCKTCGYAAPDTVEGWQLIKQHGKEHPDHDSGYGLSYQGPYDEKVQVGTTHHDAEGSWQTVHHEATGHWE